MSETLRDQNTPALYRDDPGWSELFQTTEEEIYAQIDQAQALSDPKVLRDELRAASIKLSTLIDHAIAAALGNPSIRPSEDVIHKSAFLQRLLYSAHQLQKRRRATGAD